MKEFIEKVVEGRDLTSGEAAAALEQIMTGNATDAQIAALLAGLRAKGETVDEIVGFARTMRQHSVKVHAEDPDAIDMCGTGGDGMGTFNISTVASFVVAGAGVTVAKHGNRSVSSRSGSADLLESLGVKIQIPPERVERCLNDVGLAFLFAPTFHPAMKSAAKARTEMGIRTIFNILGPLTNPAGVKKQVVGTYSPAVQQKLAEALRALSSDLTCVVHSESGLDEVSVSGRTRVYEVAGTSDLREYALSAESFGLHDAGGNGVSGGTPGQNAEIARMVLEGGSGPARDVVLANAALGIYVSGKSADLEDASARARESLDSRRALDVLNRLVEFTAA
jgi:anthranilate phosphoribosyltransferase